MLNKNRVLKLKTKFYFAMSFILINKAEQHKRDFQSVIENENSSKSSTFEDTSTMKHQTKKRKTRKKKVIHPDSKIFPELFEWVIHKCYEKVDKDIDSKITSGMKESYWKIRKDIDTLICHLNDYSENLEDEKDNIYLTKATNFIYGIRNFKKFDENHVISQNIPCFITNEHSGKGNCSQITFEVVNPKTREREKIEKFVSHEWCAFIRSWCFIMKLIGSISAYAYLNIGSFHKKESVEKIETYLQSDKRKEDELYLSNSLKRSFIFFKDFFKDSIQAKIFTENISSIWFQLEE